MKLHEFMQLPLDEALKGMQMVNLKVHTDDKTGDVASIEFKYIDPNFKTKEHDYGGYGVRK